MNYSVTGQPIGSSLDQKRQTLLQSLLRGGPGAQRLLGGAGGHGAGLVRGYTANDSPFAASPGVQFNPFLAQLQRGVGGLSLPTQSQRGNNTVNDLTGAAGPGANFSGSGAIPGVAAAQPGNGPVPDPGPQAGGAPAAPQTLTGAMSNPEAGLSGGASPYSLFEYDPTAPPPPPIPPPLPFLGVIPQRGRNIAV